MFLYSRLVKCFKVSELPSDLKLHRVPLEGELSRLWCGPWRLGTSVLLVVSTAGRPEMCQWRLYERPSKDKCQRVLLCWLHGRTSVAAGILLHNTVSSEDELLNVAAVEGHRGTGSLTKWQVCGRF